jgi:hypothetical protein
MLKTFFVVWCVHVLEAAQFDVGVKVNGLEIELVKPR